MAELLNIDGLMKYFKVPGGMLHAVDGVSFTVEAGRTLGVVGESGCGKSTLGRAILGLSEATGGRVFFDGRNVAHLRGKARKEICRDMQIIFQDPFSSLDSRMTVQQLIAEPLKITGAVKGKEEISRRVGALMDTVGLAERYRFSYPHELDGGRRQRIGIARALAVEPRFIVCDEPVSALDVSIQAQILNLMSQLQRERSLTYIFITHNLSVVKHISDEILVMYCGVLVEKAPKRDLFERPLHPYTRGLLSAIPIPSLRAARRERVLLEGEITSPINPAPGCRFCSRCPQAADICRNTTPEVREVAPDHFVACHLCEAQ